MLALQEEAATPKLEEIQSLSTPRGALDGPRRRPHDAALHDGSASHELIAVVVHSDASTSTCAVNDSAAGSSPSPKKRPSLAPPAATGTAAANAAANGKRGAPVAKILFLDGLRGLAALLVVVQHSEYMKDIPIGCAAVDAFFVLSSFLLTMLFERKARKLLAQHAGPKSWCVALADYFVKRLLRVYPLFVVITLVLWTLPDDKKKQYFFIQNPPFDLAKVIRFEFAYRYHVFWTLPVEIAYYFVIPVFVVGFLLLRKYWWVPMMPMVVYIIHQTCYVRRVDHQGLGPHLPTFLAGSCAAFIFARAQQALQEFHKEIERHRPWIVRGMRLVELIALGVLFSSCFRGLFYHWFDLPPIPTDGSFFFVSVPISTMIVVELLFPWVMAELLEWSFLRFCGKISFSLYLVHSFVIYSDWVKQQTYYYDGIAARFGLSIVLATVSYHLIEEPCQRVAVRISKAVASLDPLTAPPMTTTQPSCCWGCCSWFTTQSNPATKYKSVKAEST